MKGCLCGSVPRAEALSPKGSSNADLMHGEPADEAVVVIKHLAEEGMVTYRRVTADERAKESKDEGRNMLT